MQMPSSGKDCLGVQTGVDGLFDDITLPSFMDPGTWFDSSGATAPTATPTPIAPADTGSFWSQTLPSLLTTGLTTYAAVEAMQNPNNAVARMYSAPAGVTSQNPYGVPSGYALPAGVTPANYSYPSLWQQPAQAGIFSGSMTLPLILGGGALLLILLMPKR